VWCIDVCVSGCGVLMCVLVDDLLCVFAGQECLF